MGARTSPELIRAIELLRAEKTVSQAARETGIRRSTIYRSSLYKQLQQERKGKTT